MVKCVSNQQELNKFFTSDVASPLIGQIWSESVIMFLANATAALIIGRKVLKPGLMGSAAIVSAHALHIADHQLTEEADKAHSTEHRVLRAALNIGICYALSKKAIVVNWKWAVATPAAVAYFVEYNAHAPNP